MVDNPNYAGDHDFHRFKVTPSVFDIVDIPSDPDGSFYQGKVYVAIKDAVFEPSSALRYACEHVMVLRANGNINKA